MTPDKVMTNTSFRVSKADLAEITKRAKAAGKTRTEYLIAAALGNLATPGLAERVEALEQRVEALEAR